MSTTLPNSAATTASPLAEVNGQSAITFENVSRTYRRGWLSRGGTDALSDVSLSVPVGQVTAVLGANGAGKTTAIRCLLGLERPDAGTVRVLGQAPGADIRRQIGYVAEKPELYDWMSVEETGWFAAGFYPDGYLDAFTRWCRRLDVDAAAKVGALSKGMKAKVALSLALAHDPPLLVLDEPTSGLDPLVRREFLESMIGVAAEGRTVLLCSHQVAEVERVADRAVVLIGGHVVAEESLEQLRAECVELALRPGEEIGDPPGRVLAREDGRDERRLLVRGANEAALASWEAEVGPVTRRRPNLEDILLALLRQARGPKEDDPPTSQAA